MEAAKRTLLEGLRSGGRRVAGGGYMLGREYTLADCAWAVLLRRFIGGRGFHQTTTYIHDKWRGSHGCVNLLPQDAKAYYGVGKIGMTVKVFGRRPGT